jgi:hypothetical protein
MADRELRFVTAVASRLGVPMSLLGFSTSVRTTVAGENDRNQFVSQMSAFAKVLEDAIASMFQHVTRQRTYVNVPVRVTHALSTLAMLYQSFVIERDRYNQEMERATGISDVQSMRESDVRKRPEALLGRSIYEDGSRLAEMESDLPLDEDIQVKQEQGSYNKNPWLSHRRNGVANNWHRRANESGAQAQGWKPLNR